MSDANPVEPLDLAIRGARIVDGTGARSYVADVGVRGDKIVCIGEVPANPVPGLRRSAYPL